MQIRCDRDVLSDAIAAVMPAVARRTTLPVLGCVLVSVDDDMNVTIAATNLTQYVRVGVICGVTHKGALALPARMLADTVAAMPAGNVEIVADLANARAAIVGGGVKATIKGVAAGEFPMEVDVEGDHWLSLTGVELSAMIDATAYAAATDESRPILTGVNVARANGGWCWAAADGYRMGVISATVDNGRDEPWSVTIPAETIATLRRFTGRSSEPVRMQVSDRRVTWDIGDARVSSVVVEGQFPNVHQIMPSSHNTRIVIDRASLVQSVRTALVFARDSNSMVHLSGGLDGDVDRLRVRGESADSGDAETIIVCERWEGKPIDMAVNGRYLADAVGALGGVTVTMDVQSASIPVVLRSGGDAVAAIMPMHVNK